MSKHEVAKAPVELKVQVIDDKQYVLNGKGDLQPIETVKGQHLLEDQTVRTIIGYGRTLSDQIARFKEHTFDDISSFEAILAEKYEATKGENGEI